LWALFALVILGYAVTLNRVPTQFGDGPFYASISRSLAAGGPGIPSVLASGPTAIDHVKFYGPVFFTGLSIWFKVFGCSSWTFRVFCGLSGLLVALGGGAISWSLGGRVERRAWACLLLLLTPELGAAATYGRMDPFVVALELFGLGVFVHGITFGRWPWLHGMASGLLLTGAVLSTPRSFPFMLGFAVALVVVLPRSTAAARGTLARQAGVCVGVVGVLWLIWTIHASGGPREWFHMMAYVATHEDTDVALLRVQRDWMFVWWQSLTPTFAIAGAVILAWRLRGSGSHTIAAMFAFTVTWITFVATWTLFEFAFLFAPYAILPLFSVVIAAPVPKTDLDRRHMRVVGLALLILFVGVRGSKLVRAAVTWSARDPATLTAFVRDHVPAGSRVAGRGHGFFFAVEEAGSHYLVASQVSAADWARWMPAIERRTPPPTRPILADYLLWPNDVPLALVPPIAMTCRAAVAVAAFTPAPPNIPALSSLAAGDPDAGYAPATLYRLKPTCDTAHRAD